METAAKSDSKRIRFQQNLIVYFNLAEYPLSIPGLLVVWTEIYSYLLKSLLFWMIHLVENVMFWQAAVIINSVQQHISCANSNDHMRLEQLASWSVAACTASASPSIVVRSLIDQCCWWCFAKLLIYIMAEYLNWWLPFIKSMKYDDDCQFV